MVVCQFVHRTGLEITFTVDIGDGSSRLGMKRHPIVRNPRPAFPTTVQAAPDPS